MEWIGDPERMASVNRKIHAHLETHLIAVPWADVKPELQCNMRWMTPHDVLRHLDHISLF